MGVSWYVVAFLAAGALGASIAPEQTQDLEKVSCGRVWVTVHSPDIRLGVVNRLRDAVELNWDFSSCASVPARIGLFNGRPSTWNNVLASFVILSREGHVVTNVSLGPVTLPGGWETAHASRGPQCMWPWVGAGNTQNIQISSCLRIQPTWMLDHAGRIGRLPIGNLAIPGTHNAGSWRFNTETSTAERDTFVLCQDRSIWAQLVHGIRYFDFRVGFYNEYERDDDKYWLNHNLIRVRPLVPLLREIKAFLDVTREVVFLDFHHLPVGFYLPNGRPISAVHSGLLRLVQRELGLHLASASEFGTGRGTRGPALQTFMNANRRLVFSYVDNQIVAANPWVWPHLPHLWANTNSPSQLLRFLDDAIARSPAPGARSPLFSAMAQTTPTVLDILLLRGSIRENADAVNRNVTARLGTRWRSRANIVSTDFFLGSGVVDLSIQINLDRSTML